MRGGKSMRQKRRWLPMAKYRNSSRCTPYGVTASTSMWRANLAAANAATSPRASGALGRGWGAAPVVLVAGGMAGATGP